MRSSVLARDERTEAAGLVVETWLLLVSTYALIVAGAVLLAVTELSLTYAFAAALLCATHALIVGPKGRSILSPRVSQMLALCALVFCLIHARYADVHTSYGLGHFLILVQLIMLYGEHRVRDMHLIQVTVIFEILIAAIWALELVYLLAFLLTIACLMANMMAVEMHRSAGRRRVLSSAQAAAPRLMDFLAAAWLPVLVVLACTAAGFVTLPRSRWFQGSRRSLTGLMIGLSENVSLREVGALRQSGKIVLKAQFFAVGPGQYVLYEPNTILMRGTSLPTYKNGQWFGHTTPIRQPYFSSPHSYYLTDTQVEGRDILQRIELEEASSYTLFALYRPVRLRGHEPYAQTVDPISHQLICPPFVWQKKAYEVVSLLPDFTPEQLRAAGTPRPAAPPFVFWQVPEKIRPVLQETVAEIERLYRPTTDYDRIVAAQNYLVNSGRFTYTHDLPEFEARDPIAAFLTETRRGSCEQFSTALALITRMWSIPTRLVVGLKDGEFDPGRRSYVFRESDAHAWVEAYFNDLGWVQFDPSPGSDLSGSTRRVPEGILDRMTISLGLFLSRANRWVHHIWSANVVGYDGLQQRRLFAGVSQVARDLARDATAVLRALVPGMPDLGLPQIIVLMAAFTLVGMSLYVAGRWLEPHLLLWRRRARRGTTVRFYEELLRILRKKGVPKPPSSTPRELARNAFMKLAQANEESHALQSAINLVTDLYCRVRFGDYGLSEQERGRVREALQTLKRARRAGSP